MRDRIPVIRDGKHAGKPRCQKMVNGSGSWGSFHQHQCDRVAVEGEFCKVHGETAQKARDLKGEIAYRERRRSARNLENILALGRIRDGAAKISDDEIRATFARLSTAVDPRQDLIALVQKLAMDDAE